MHPGAGGCDADLGLRCHGMMATAIRDNGPAMIFDDNLMYHDKSPVRDGADSIPLGQTVSGVVTALFRPTFSHP